jgi:hypothetical protein
MIDLVEADRRDLKNIKNELDEYGDDEELLDEEKDIQLDLLRRSNAVT